MITIPLLIASIVVALAMANMEIQIEGKNGWASALPAWRKRVNIKWLWNYELTGYHFYLALFIISMSHLVFAFIPWSLAIELQIVNFVFIVLWLEDFFWFVFNPHYGIKKFRKGEVPWHKDWLLGVPSVYWLNILAIILVHFIALNINY